MKHELPSKVLITGGREVGGVRSVAEGLRAGFDELGIPAEVVAPARILCHWRELRNPGILKILGTSAVFAAPMARRAICIAHGYPSVQLQGWPKALAILSSLKLAAASRGAQLVTVSEYSAVHLGAIYKVRVDAVIRNPLHPLFTQAKPQTEAKREAITYVGRLHISKNIHRLLPAMRDVLDENPGLCAWIVGEGEMRPALEEMAAKDARIQFLGELEPEQVRERLRRSRVFVSAHPFESFGIVYLEALSQGCAVAMPASGGGLEIAPGQIGGAIHLFSALAARAEIASALRKALLAEPAVVPLTAYSVRAVAEAYLARDASFSAQGVFSAEALP
jgi:glycosyltransferase involved in cell wall biosynthesis